MRVKFMFCILFMNPVVGCTSNIGQSPKYVCVCVCVPCTFVQPRIERYLGYYSLIISFTEFCALLIIIKFEKKKQKLCECRIHVVHMKFLKSCKFFIFSFWQPNEIHENCMASDDGSHDKYEYLINTFFAPKKKKKSCE